MKRREHARLAAALAVAVVAAARRRRRMRPLSGQRVLITGGSRGLGLLLARECLRRGCKVAICARDAAELADAQHFLGSGVITGVCDVSQRSQVERVVASVGDRLGGIDMLINNAGVMDVGPVETMRIANFERALAVMYWGVLYPTLAVLPQMRARRTGRIVTITSIGGRISVPHLLPYSCAKFAAVGFSEGLRAELAGTGVMVTTVIPGLMRTGSYINARFHGQPQAEFTWFGLGATLPGLSMDAERAARQIVDAAARGDSQVTLSPPAKLASLMHGLFPGLTADALGWADRLILPRPATTDPPVRGTVLARRQGRWLRALTHLGRVASRRFQPRGALSAGDRTSVN